MTTTEILIVGQGLAGSVLAWRLAGLGRRVLIADRGGVDDWGRPSSSRVAAGLITPVTGRRLTIDARWREMAEEAFRFYRGVEEQAGVRLLDQSPSLRLFASAEEQRLFARRLAGAAVAEQAVPMEEAGAGRGAPPGVGARHGGFWMPHAARLDCARLLDATREWFARRGLYRRAAVGCFDDWLFEPRGVVVPGLGVVAERVVLCLGFTAARLPAVLAAPLEPAKGEILTVEAPGLNLHCVTHRGVWVAPAAGLGADRYLVGATHAWDEIDSLPTAAGREELLGRLAELTPARACVLGHAAAVRPATADREPIARFVAPDRRVAVFNGLGAKGALRAPWQAARLAEALDESLRARTPPPAFETDRRGW